jgi:hypothetical protein
LIQFAKKQSKISQVLLYEVIAVQAKDNLDILSWKRLLLLWFRQSFLFLMQLDEMYLGF